MGISFNQPKDWGKWRGYNKPKWGNSPTVSNNWGYHADIAKQSADWSWYLDVFGTQKMLVMERHNPWKHLVSSIFKPPPKSQAEGIGVFTYRRTAGCGEATI